MREPIGLLGTTKCPTTLRSRPSFTLVEIMAVITIIGVLSGLGISRTWSVAEAARTARAIAELRNMSLELSMQDSLPASLAGIHRDGRLDPWGYPYQYLLFPAPSGHRNDPPPAGARKDRFLVPINSRYDLYSVGPDGQSKAPLTAKQSRDDIIYANDGAYIGKASGY